MHPEPLQASSVSRQLQRLFTGAVLGVPRPARPGEILKMACRACHDEADRYRIHLTDATAPPRAADGTPQLRLPNLRTPEASALQQVTFRTNMPVRKTIR